MKFSSILGILLFFAIVFAGISADGQIPNDTVKNRVVQMMAQGNYVSTTKLVDAQETLWKSARAESYFTDMGTIACVLIDGTNDRFYWLGRRVIWDVLLKPTPNELGAARDVYSWKRTLLSVGAEGMTPYFAHVSQDMYAAIRHDTFLMLEEYVRQLHAEIIPGYQNKWRGAMEEDTRPFTQNAIDNDLQEEDRAAIRWLAEDQDDYLIDAYSTEPRDDQELKLLFDILNIRGADRERVTQNTR